MTTSLKFDVDENGAKVDNSKYLGMIDSLFYLTTVGPIFCVVFVYVLVFKHVQNNFI